MGLRLGSKESERNTSPPVTWDVYLPVFRCRSSKWNIPWGVLYVVHVSSFASVNYRCDAPSARKSSATTTTTISI